MTSVNYKTIHPVGIFEGGSSQEQLVVIQGVNLFLECDGPLELVEMVIRWLTYHTPFKVGGLFSLLNVLLDLLNGTLMLQVGLTIQVLGFNIAEPAIVAGFDENEVCREELIRFDAHYIAYSQILPLVIEKVFVGVTFCLCLISLDDCSCIFHIICSMPFHIFKDVLHPRHHYYKQKRH